MLTEDDLLFGKIAIDLHLLDPAQLERIKSDLATANRRIGEYLIQKGMLRLDDLGAILAEQKKRKLQRALETAPAIVPRTPLPPPVAKPALLPPVSAPPERSTAVSTPRVPSIAVSPPPAPELLASDRLQELLAEARRRDASDLHISVGSPPFLRRYKRIEPLGDRPLTPEQTEAILFGAISEAQKRNLLKDKSLGFSLRVGANERYRTCMYKQVNGWEGVFRVIPDRIRTFDELKLPPPLRRLTEYHQGLVLVTGPSGSGKTTTMAALIDLINATREDHIITIEDPIEYAFPSKKCQVTQRELGAHTMSYAAALRAALREDPDIIMIGEMRDLQTMALAVSAAETGHLVFGTLPTGSAIRTISAVLDYFPPDQQGQIRSMISESLRGIISQHLFARKDGKGVAQAIEVLMVDPAVSTMIRQNQLHQLTSKMQTSKAKGAMLMDESLLELVRSGAIDAAEAAPLSDNPAVILGAARS